MQSKKNLRKSALTFTCFFFFLTSARSQCASTVLVGYSGNMYTQIINCTKPLVVDKNLNMVALVHRTDASVFGGNAGDFRYGLSSNGGTSWSTNLGPLNPIGSSNGRYPSGVIHNPPANTNTALASLGYFGPTTFGTTWNGVVTGTKLLGSTSASENYNQPVSSLYHISGTAVKGGTGEFWAAGPQYNGVQSPGAIIIYKGTWDGVSEIIWATNTIIAVPSNTYASGGFAVAECDIAFDPTGSVGWMCVTANPLTSPGNNKYYPVFYKTTDGGATWSTPTLFDYTQYACVSASLAANTTPSIDREMALTVDVNKNPHLLVLVGSTSGQYQINFSTWHGLYDVTIEKGIWTTRPVSPVKAGPSTLSGGLFKVTPQISRTADGAKLFFGWCDNSGYTMGDPNVSPNFFARGFDVLQNLWTPTKDFTSCNTQIAGSIFYNHVAAEVLEPTSSQFKLASVYGKMSTANDPLSPSELYFLDNCLFYSNDFSNPEPIANVLVLPNPAVVCPLGTTVLTPTTSYNQYLWSNGVSTHSMAGAMGNHTLTVRNGCAIGTATVSVEELTLTPVFGNTTICEGSSVSLAVKGNASTYSWVPGNSTGSVIVVSPTITTSYLIVASTPGCGVSANINVTVDECSGLNETEIEKPFAVYPTPSSGLINIKSDRKINLLIYDATGKLVNTIFLNDVNTYTTTLTLSKGLYVISEAGKPSFLSKILIE